jgi:transposase InsO family protein
VKFAAIADWAAEEDNEFSVVYMCEQLEVSTSGFYKWCAHTLSQRETTDHELLDQIRLIHHNLDGRPGVRRVWAELAALGWRVGRKRVWRLMRDDGLQGRHPPRSRVTTVAGRRPIDAPDLLGQDFTAAVPDVRWCGDITYISTVDGWAYLATVIDLHSRKIVGWALDDHMRTSLVTDALGQALATRKPPAGVIFHSDRGCQYTAHEFAEFCEANGVRRSMGRRATCYDNSVAESFFATYKKELIHTRPWNTLSQVREHTFLWIEGYYNRTRRHSTLSYLTPDEYELGFRNVTELAV